LKLDLQRRVHTPGQASDQMKDPKDIRRLSDF